MFAYRGNFFHNSAKLHISYAFYTQRFSEEEEEEEKTKKKQQQKKNKQKNKNKQQQQKTTANTNTQRNEIGMTVFFL